MWRPQQPHGRDEFNDQLAHVVVGKVNALTSRQGVVDSGM
jgi:hypothetical protein